MRRVNESTTINSIRLVYKGDRSWMQGLSVNIVSELASLIMLHVLMRI